ncbi:MAG: methylated-DNA--[protein]-cysteine S-methyltransferase [Helicobacter sp.]|uniref:methylated-DNA--[protein]-cysteine S-methyltransferase n=1 Tax=Helicobacter sp. TaxID=218 RepID=UPI0023D390B2|nr:methylated-DNA--[protein]-cysteine S-methyltransferase [Helicobacter sp.]MDE5926673.1 methylated-DNA--[protein]-cysteine S-methyltransferase [Helicobacter sp.]MDE7176010.1 methylated-DNA--[protein]-cysteine S-methyltransferase [Helicobacter sp.]
MKIFEAILQSPLGEILIKDNGKAILEVCFVDSQNSFSNTSPLTLEAMRQLKEYFALQRKEFDLPLLPYGTEFQKSVWKELCAIPYGEVRTYGAIAQKIHKPKAARAVGAANHHNPIAILIPCHRVIGANGKLVGYASGIAKKAALLELEGAILSQQCNG